MANRKQTKRVLEIENKALMKNKVIAVIDERQNTNIYKVSGEEYTKEELDKAFKDDEVIYIHLVNEERKI